MQDTRISDIKICRETIERMHSLMIALEAESSGNGDELRIDACCRRVVISRLSIDAIRRIAHPKGEATSGISAGRAGSRAGQSLAGADESAGAVKSPPEPGLRARRCRAKDGN